MVTDSKSRIRKKLIRPETAFLVFLFALILVSGFIYLPNLTGNSVVQNPALDSLIFFGVALALVILTLLLLYRKKICSKKITPHRENILFSGHRKTSVFLVL